MLDLARSRDVLIITHSDALPDNGVTRDLADRGCRLLWRRAWLGELLPPPDPEALAGVVIFGGPQFVTEVADHPWMQTEIDWIGTFVRAGGRCLGLCLGAQMIAHALGARVWRYDDHTSEIGFYPITAVGNEGGDLFAGTDQFYQWHLEGFEIPDGATKLATNRTFPNQAFRWGERTFGFQFHPEITLSMIERWTGFVSAEKPEMFERPNATLPPAHFEGWKQHSEAVINWRGRFIDRWLSS